MDLEYVSGGERGSSQDSSKNRTFILEMIFFGSLILLNILDFTEKLPPDFDYIKKIISWSALGFLLYKASLTKIFFGDKKPHLDLFLIFSYFLMILKNFVLFARQVLRGVEEKVVFESGKFVTKHVFEGADFPTYLLHFYQSILNNAVILETGGFILGFISLIIISFYVAKSVHIRYPSLLQVLGNEGSFKGNLSNFLYRFICIFFVLSMFFVICFNLMMEWLAIAVDAPLLMIGLVFYLFMAPNLNMGDKMEKLGNMGEDFYESFVEMFAKKETIIWAVAGMLVLHILTDVANFIFPYILGFHDALYSTTLDHGSLYEIAYESIQGLILTDQIMLVLGYVMNVIGILFLMVGPGYIWYRIWKGKEFHFKPWLVFVIVSSTAYSLLNPVFKVGMVTASNLLGALITMNPISHDLSIFIFSLVLGLLCSVVSINEKFKIVIMNIMMVVVEVFFLRHIYFYFVSVIFYYKDAILSLYLSSNYVMLFAMSILAIETLFFYLIGPLGYVIKSWE